MATTTYTLLNNSDTVPVNVLGFGAAPKEAFKVIDTIVDRQKGSREAEYQKVTGDEEYPMALRVGHYVNDSAEGGVGRTNVSLKLSTFLQKADEDDVIFTLPAWVTIAISMPGKSGIPDVDGTISLLTSAMSWILPIIAGEISPAALDEIKYGVVNGLAAHEDSSAV